MRKKLKPVPYFKTENEERAFWESHDSADYVDWSKAERVRLPNPQLAQPDEPPETPETKTAAAD